jgi:general secretion pathway protein F
MREPSSGAPMTPFRYRASTGDGAIVDGVVRAASRESALRELRRQQLWPVTVAVATDSGVGAPSRFAGTTARRRDVALWTRTVATLLAAGAAMDRALTVAQAQVSHPDVVRAARTITTAVKGGASLADAMRAEAASFSALNVGMVEAGERSGALAVSLDTLAGYLDDEEAVRADVRTALLYPLLMACVATAGILVLLLVVVPRFSALLADLGGTLPLSTRILIAAGAFIGQRWWLLLLFGGVGVVGVRAWLASPGARERWHATRLTIPLVGRLERSVTTSRYTRALSMMLRGGLSLLPAMRLATGAATNLALRGGLERASHAVARGEPLASALEGTLTPIATQLLSVGDESGQVEAIALRISTTLDQETRRTVRSLTTLLEPALILLFGAIVGFVALAMLQAIYAINTGA